MAGGSNVSAAFFSFKKEEKESNNSKTFNMSVKNIAKDTKIKYNIKIRKTGQPTKNTDPSHILRR